MQNGVLFVRSRRGNRRSFRRLACVPVFIIELPGEVDTNGVDTYGGEAGRLLSEVSTRNGGYSKTFAYDGSNTAGPGNPTTIHGTNPSFNADNQNTSYTVDGNGNSTSTGDQISYDNFSHAYLIANGSTDLQAANTRVDNGLQFWRYDYTTGGLYFFLYDGDAQTTYLYYTGAVAIYQTLGPNGYLNFRSQSVGGVLGVEQFYAFDPAGNFALDLNTAGSILGTTIVDAYGVSVISGINDDSGMQWGGGYYNSGITPYLLKARRYYDGISGRFLSRDPIGYGGGINQYAFAGNDPENIADPSGLQQIELPGDGDVDGVDTYGGGDTGGDTLADQNVDSSTFITGGRTTYVPVLPPEDEPATSEPATVPCPTAAGADQSGTPSGGTGPGDDGSTPGPGITLALSVGPALKEFTSRVGGQNYSTWGNGPDWKPAFQSLMSDTDNFAHFNLDVPGCEPINAWSSAQGAISGSDTRATSWELGQIYQDPEWWNRISWWKDGVLVPNPFE